VTKSSSFYQKRDGIWYSVNESRVLTAAGNPSDALVTVERSQVGSPAAHLRERVNSDGVVETVNSQSSFAERKRVDTMTSSRHQGVSVETVTRNGRLETAGSFEVPDPQRYLYDGFGRLTQALDPRTNKGVLRSFDAAGRVLTETDEEGRVTTRTYYPAGHPSAGLLASVSQPGRGPVRRAYDAQGQLTHTWGGGDYPVKWQRVRDSNGILTSVVMTTYQGGSDWTGETPPAAFEASGSAPMTVTWNLDSAGRVSGVIRAGKTTSYQYYANNVAGAGLLWKRTWARLSGGQPVGTAYGYDGQGRRIIEGPLTAAANLTTLGDVKWSYDRVGRLTGTMDPTGESEWRYVPGKTSLESITYAGTFSGANANLPLAGAQLVFSNDKGRRTRTRVTWAETPLEVTVDRGYHPGTGLVESYALDGRSVTVERAEDSRLVKRRLFAGGRRQTLTHTDTGAVDTIQWGTEAVPAQVLGMDYRFDSAGRRAGMEREDGTEWSYSYNGKGEVTEGKRHQTGQTNALPGWYFGYGYDEFGNRTSIQREPGQTVAASHNSHGQLTTPANPGTARFLARAAVDADPGLLQNGSAVTVARDQAAAEGFSGVLTRTDGWETVKVTAKPQGLSTPTTMREGAVEMRPAAEVLSYDDDGNLTGDWRWTYVWDRENRLMSMTTTSTAVAAGAPNLKLDYVYDGFGRRVMKQVSRRNTAGTAWVLEKELRFLYEGWNLVAEVSTLKPGSATARAVQPLRTYLWGEDLSGTETGAGGVGGLLLVKQHAAVAGESWTGWQVPCLDGNGNVLAYLDADSGEVMSRFEYDPFGRTVVAETVARYSKKGTAAAKRVPVEAPPFRFSTKYEDGETGLVYYGYRYYAPVWGRWVSRDPIGERGGLNLYGMVGNDAVNWVDYLGHQAAGSCNCGPDITEALRNTLKAVGRAFRAATPDERDRACSKIVGGGGWEITDLKAQNYTKACGERDKTNASSCRKTVTVQGGCYYLGSVNYILYGRAFKLCDKWKIWRYLTTLGYKGIPGVLEGRAGNYGASQAWGSVGHNNWVPRPTLNDVLNPPTGPVMRPTWEDMPDPESANLEVPDPDRPNCKPCKTTVSKVLSGHLGGVIRW
jgi:RHS repeat-associated protein